MPRNKVITEVTVEEDIQSYTHNTGGWIDVVVGVGNTVDGEFKFNVPQQFTSFQILDDDYAALMEDKPVWSRNKPAGHFRLDDLWVAVDARRANKPLRDMGNV